MRSALVSLVALLCCLASFSGPAVAQDLGLVTGSEKGTYYQFGLNLQILAKQKGINLAVHPSKGSIENVFAVYQRPGVQMGIVQSDVLAFVARVETDPVLKRIARKTKMVFPLYNEEVHLLGRPDIATFDDLADRRVAIGREGSGNYLTSRLLFRMAEVTPREMLAIDTDEALAALKAGRIDAMFYVAGFPVKLLNEGVTEADGLTLIPITNKSITEFYPRAEIPAGTYKWQARPVDTVAVKSVLISFDYRRRDCDNVGRFAQILSDNRAWLVQNGHPKWRSVDLDYQLRGWEQYDCVRRYLGKAPQAPRARTAPVENPVMDAIKQILGD
ncbi:MAG TPA: TAXI family TRAP transporter solute-binding subunit [Methylomirabilota bacterium]